MQVHYNIDQLPDFKNAALTIGTFDGVHEGHRRILKQLKEEAKAIKGESVLITFYPHPRRVVGDTSGVKLLTTLEEKSELLKAEGVDHLVVVPFDEGFSKMPADAYITEFLWKKLKPSTVIIGYDHKFGKGRKGDYQLLERYGNELGFEVKEIPEHILQEVVISSTAIRKALLHCDTTIANNFLGYPYFINGTVIQGDKIGRTIGYPTANIQVNHEEKLVPGDGVYAVKLDVAEGPSEWQSLEGMLYIGSRPVVNGTRRVIEVNIFDFDSDIYGKQLKVCFYNYIRGDIHFKGLEGLKEQLADDKVKVMDALRQ